ncbi:MAG TPA: carboxypeptidase-like regulatory domain-containing protein, partial [Chitinophagaceae bacterium]|nr:carboxypeptidase-like regulatory domain-containing protein [Chitinophagaceae bacterium]
MKRILFLMLPVVLALLAFRPVTPHTVTGTITGDDGFAISSVNVVLKGTKVAVRSAADGSYRITVSDKDATLVFSAVGYTTQTIKIKGRKVIDVVMVASTHELSEV